MQCKSEFGLLDTMRTHLGLLVLWKCFQISWDSTSFEESFSRLGALSASVILTPEQYLAVILTPGQYLAVIVVSFRSKYLRFSCLILLIYVPDVPLIFNRDVMLSCCRFGNVLTQFNVYVLFLSLIEPGSFYDLS